MFPRPAHYFPDSWLARSWLFVRTFPAKVADLVGWAAEGNHATLRHEQRQTERGSSSASIIVEGSGDASRRRQTVTREDDGSERPVGVSWRLLIADAGLE